MRFKDMLPVLALVTVAALTGLTAAGEFPKPIIIFAAGVESIDGVENAADAAMATTIRYG